MLMRKINAVISLITTLLLLDHAIFMGVWMLSMGEITQSASKLPRILFVLMMVLANESYLIASQSTDKKSQVIKEYKEHFGAGCSKALSCQSVCPMEIETITSIMRMNRK